MATIASRSAPSATLRGVASPSLRPARALVAPRRAHPARRHQVVSVRAADKQGIDIEQIKDTYVKVTNAVPPVVTAATVPVIGLSLLCKTLTGELRG